MSSRALRANLVFLSWKVPDGAGRNQGPSLRSG